MRTYDDDLREEGRKKGRKEIMFPLVKSLLLDNAMSLSEIRRLYHPFPQSELDEVVEQIINYLKQGEDHEAMVRKRANALVMIADGSSTVEIVECTGLSTEIIETLKEDSEWLLGKDETKGS